HPRQQLPGAMPSAMLASVSPAPTATADAVKPADVSLAPPVPANIPAQRPSGNRPAAQAALAQLQAAAAPVDRATPANPASPASQVPPMATPARATEQQKTHHAAAVESMQELQAVAFAFAFIPV